MLILNEPAYEDILTMYAPLIFNEKIDEYDEFTTLTNRLKGLEKQNKKY
jgi:hypothetical protein